MAIIDVVKWDHASPDIFAWKFPETNLTTFTQLIVYETQEAVFFHKGKIIATFSAGKHVLSTENIPVLENLYGIPFGGQNPFTAEVWFINKIYSLDIKWGTSQPFQIRDPEFNILVPVRVNGQFGMKIGDSIKFLLKVVGNQPQLDKGYLTDYFRGMLLTKAATIISKKIKEETISLIDIVPHLEDLSIHLKNELSTEFQSYGIDLVNFFINNISIPEEDPAVIRLKEMLSRKAEMDLLGYNYHQQRSFDVLEGAAQSDGTAGSLAGAGMGFGMGMGMVNQTGGFMNQLNTHLNPMEACPHCRQLIPAGALFCSTCGKKCGTDIMDKQQVVCDKCGNPIPEKAKFCPHCGDQYNACPRCKADLPEHIFQCPHCGEGMPTVCGNCEHRVPAGAKFCPHCGNQTQSLCPSCGSEITKGIPFCAHCGQKIIE